MGTHLLSWELVQPCTANCMTYLTLYALACVASVSVGFSAHSRRFSLFGGTKIGASATLMEAVGKGRGGEKRKRLPASPMILKDAHLTLSQLDKFTV